VTSRTGRRKKRFVVRLTRLRCAIIRCRRSARILRNSNALLPDKKMLAPIVVALFFAGSLSAGYVLADVRDTKHNLTGNSSTETATSLTQRRSQNQEVCVFCHTPGITELIGGGGVPSERRVAKWQRSVEAAFTFELFDDIGKTGADGAFPVGSVSVACLSCHDSAQAFGVSPGASSDHPFGVPYRGLAQTSAGAAAKFADRMALADAPYRQGVYQVDESGFRPARSGVVNKREIWWAATIDSGRRTKNDLPLYPRRVDNGSGYDSVPFVECTSCHDPHSSREVFLRTSNDQSKLCMTCHTK
jgi:predicted CXXCH cytochrome family protein